MGTTSEKLTYLNTTKEKIRDSINLTGANLTGEDTFRSYASKLKKGYIDIINNGIDTLYNNFPKVSGIGSNLSLTPTYEAPIKLNEIQGDTLQDGTPTPDTPVEIQSVTGLQNVEVCGKNLLDLSKCINGYINSSGGIGESNYDLLSDYIKVESGKNYTISLNTQFYNIGYAFYDSSKTYILRYNTNRNLTTLTTTIPSGTSYIRIWFNYNGTTTLTPANILQYEPMVENNSTATTYEPYKGNTYEVNLGKNLLDISDITTTSYITNNGDGSITLNGLGESISFPLSKPFTLKANTTYTLSLTNTDSSYAGATFILRNGNTNIFPISYSESEKHYTPTEDVVIDTLRIYGAGLTFDNYTFSIQLEKGSKATSYSPYFTPIELNKIGDYKDSIKKSTGKNLFDKDNVNSLQAYFNTGATNKISASTNARTIYIPCKPNTTYTISKITSARFYVGYTNETPALGVEVFGRDGENNKNTPITITTGANATYIVSFIYLATAEALTLQQILDTIQIEENNQATTYEPYGKVWYVEKNIGKVVLNGSETYETTGTNTSGKYKIRYDGVVNLIKRPANANTIGDIISNQFIPLSASDTYRCSQGISIEISGKISFYDETLTQSTSAFKTWLSTHNTEVLYVLATPEYTEITNTELIEDLETLYTAKSQEETTNISITSEDLEMILNVSALKGDA